MLLLLVAACSGETVEVEVTRIVEVTPVGGMVIQEANRLQAIKDRDVLICASRNDVPGYGFLDASGNNQGFDIDLCRAVAAAVLGDPNKIEIRLISAAERGPDDSSLAKLTCWFAPSPGPPPATPSGATMSRPCSTTARPSWSEMTWA